MSSEPGVVTKALSSFSSPTPVADINVMRPDIPEWMINSRPSSAFAGEPIESLSDGISPIEEIRAAVAAIPPEAISEEGDWMKLARGLAHHAAHHPDQEKQLWEMLDQASRGAANYDESDNQTRWERYKQEAHGHAAPITVATVFRLARHCGRGGRSPHAANRGSPAGPQGTQVEFRDRDRWGHPKPSLANAVTAINTLGISARYNLFHHRIEVAYKGEAKTVREGLLTDDTIGAVRSLINNTFMVDCGDAITLAAIKEIARENAYDPVLDLLNECQDEWDKVPRLDTWVINYLGCEDTPLSCAIGRAVLVAACRRARVPGCKFDFITVLEGPEGIEKSTAIRVLAGDEFFSDQSILGANDKEVQEQLEGVWMHENADLAGMRKADVETMKAFASRQVDRARPAYGRVREDRPRRSIEWGTTNNDLYLQSQTGNRRWWTLRTEEIDIEGLKRDRRQLLGEAATHEAAGESIGLDESLWNDARNAQEQRRVTDPWEDILVDMPNHIIKRTGDGFEQVASADVLENALQIQNAHRTSALSQRLAHAMKHTGWERNASGKVMIEGRSVRGFIRPEKQPA
jgi:predicted P-loop ATPase